MVIGETVRRFSFCSSMPVFPLPLSLIISFSFQSLSLPLAISHSLLSKIILTLRQITVRPCPCPFPPSLISSLSYGVPPPPTLCTTIASTQYSFIHKECVIKHKSLAPYPQYLYCITALGQYGPFIPLLPPCPSTRVFVFRIPQGTFFGRVLRVENMSVIG